MGALKTFPCKFGPSAMAVYPLNGYAYMPAKVKANLIGGHEENPESLRLCCDCGSVALTDCIQNALDTDSLGLDDVNRPRPS